MTFRITGLTPFAALLAAGVAHAQATLPPSGGGGQMAYPTSLPSGQFRQSAPTAADTGNMAYPTSGQTGGGIQAPAPTTPDTGNMAYPAGQSLPNGAAAPRGRMGMRAAAAANGGSGPMRPDVAPTPAQTAAARELETAPAAQPVPYTDFVGSQRAASGRMMHGHMMMHHTGMHHVRTHSTATPASAPTPSTPAK